MSRIFILLLISMFFLASSVAMANEEFEKKCAQWAIEDEVSDADKPAFIQDCVQNLIDEQAQSSGGDQS